MCFLQLKVPQLTFFPHTRTHTRYFDNSYGYSDLLKKIKQFHSKFLTLSNGRSNPTKYRSTALGLSWSRGWALMHCKSQEKDKSQRSNPSTGSTKGRQFAQHI